MKPTKNRVFCPAYKRSKMLFDSKSKAMNFIRFNADDVAAESGVKPVRAYYCTACGGWHVTSSPLAKSNDMMVRKCLRIVRHAEIENDTLHAKRFLCWAERYASNMDSDDNRRVGLLNEIKKQSSGLTNTLRIQQNARGRMPEEQLLQVVAMECKPQLICQHDGKFYYSLCKGRLTAEEMEKTLAVSQLGESESFCQVSSHRLAVADMERGGWAIVHKNQYANLKEMFPDLLEAHFRGNYLHAFELSPKPQMKYMNVSHYDYWIRFGERNVRFFHGSLLKLFCLCTEKPIDQKRILTIYKQVDMAASDCKFYGNYMDDAVIREDQHGQRFVKYLGCNDEIGPCEKSSKVAFGGESFGIFHELEPITRDEYESFGKAWVFSSNGSKVAPAYSR